MSEWALVVAMGGNLLFGSSVSGFNVFDMTEAQCRQTMAEISPVSKGGRFGAVCVGPNGETVQFKDVEVPTPENTSPARKCTAAGAC